MKKLRLLLWRECNKSCTGCCNQYFRDLETMDSSRYIEFDEIYLTGGEPMLYPDRVIEQVRVIRENGFKGKMYVYTAGLDSVPDLIRVLTAVDGLTITLHNGYPEDTKKFIALEKELIRTQFELAEKSLRLNVFEGIEMGEEFKEVRTWRWIIKDNIRWIENCPLPKDEVFMKV